MCDHIMTAQLDDIEERLREETTGLAIHAATDVQARRCICQRIEPGYEYDDTEVICRYCGRLLHSRNGFAE